MTKLVSSGSAARTRQTCSPTGLLRRLSGDPDRSPDPKGLEVEEELRLSGWYTEVLSGAGLKLEDFLRSLSRDVHYALVEIDVPGKGTRFFGCRRLSDGFDLCGPQTADGAWPIVKAWAVLAH